MLESAITKSSDSVALDLLTYADLETLRKTKFGSGNTSGRGFTPGKNKAAHAKRYLILTYSVEFDRLCVCVCTSAILYLCTVHVELAQDRGEIVGLKLEHVLCTSNSYKTHDIVECTPL